jgi:hypothetical protein
VVDTEQHPPSVAPQSSLVGAPKVFATVYSGSYWARSQSMASGTAPSIEM